MRLFKKNELIFNQNDQGDCAYIIEKGRVQIFLTKDKEEIPLSMLGEGEIFGEMSLLDNLSRSASAKAIEDCQLNIVNKSQLMERIYSADTIVRLLMRVLLRRLRGQNDAISGLKTDPAHDPLTEVNESEALSQIKLENKVFEAFRNKEFLMFQQPIVRLSAFDAGNKASLAENIYGSESLLRWKSPLEGMIAPNLFIDIIENSSMIIPIGEWIIEESFRQTNLLQNKKKNFSVSINISGRQFVHHHFIDRLAELQKKYSIDPKTIKLEMTERILMDGVVVLENLNRCHDLGFKISIDDFGTGFSSLQYLSKMPIDYLKIDSSFVQKMLGDRKIEAVVKSISYLAKSLDMKIIAEGIETKEQQKYLSELGCDFGQGFLFSKAIPTDDLLKLL